MTNPTHSQDQDLRTAAEFLMAHLGDPEDAQSCYCYPDPSGLRDAMERVRDALRAAPPRPVDAERVEDEQTSQFIADCDRIEAEQLASPAHSPDKAVTREGLGWPTERAEVLPWFPDVIHELAQAEAGLESCPTEAQLDRLSGAVLNVCRATKAYGEREGEIQDIIINLSTSLRLAGDGPAYEMPDAIQSAIDGLNRLYVRVSKLTAPEAQEGLPKIIEAADTPASTGPADMALTCEWPCGRETTEFVSVEAARLLGYRYPDEEAYLAPKPTGTEAGRGAMPAGWKLAPSKLTYAMADELFRTTFPALSLASAQRLWGAALAATPTPPVSPTPDSTGPAGDAWARLRAAAVRILGSHDRPDVLDTALTELETAVRATPLRFEPEDVQETFARLSQELGVTGTANVFRESLRLAKEAAAHARMMATPGVKTQLRENARLMREQKAAALTPSAPIAPPDQKQEPYGWLYKWNYEDAGGGLVDQFSRVKPEEGNPYVSGVIPLYLAPASDAPGEAQTQEGGWRPINEAERNGVWFRAKDTPDGEAYTVRWCDGHDGVFRDHNNYVRTPSLFMPPAPADRSEGGR